MAPVQWSDLPGDEHYALCQSSLYHLSLPEHAGDPSDGWLLSLYSPLLEWKQNHFVVHKSCLCIVAKSNERDPVAWWHSDSEEAFAVGRPVRVKILTMSNGFLTHVKGLKHDEFLVSTDDLSVGLSTKDFGGCKGNCVYMAHRHYTRPYAGIFSDHDVVFDFDTLATTSLTAETARDRAKIYWPPPDWLHHKSIQDPPPCS